MGWCAGLQCWVSTNLSDAIEWILLGATWNIHSVYQIRGQGQENLGRTFFRSAKGLASWIYHLVPSLQCYTLHTHTGFLLLFSVKELFPLILLIAMPGKKKSTQLNVWKQLLFLCFVSLYVRRKKKWVDQTRLLIKATIYESSNLLSQLWIKDADLKNIYFQTVFLFLNLINCRLFCSHSLTGIG